MKRLAQTTSWGRWPHANYGETWGNANSSRYLVRQTLNDSRYSEEPPNFSVKWKKTW